MMRPGRTPRVLFVDQYARMGGGQRILLDIAQHFAANHIECRAALPESGPLEQLLLEHGIETSHFTLPELRAGSKSFKDQLAYLPGALTAKKQIERIARGFDADLVFCNGPRAVLPSVLAAAALDLPIICAVHLIFAGKERALLSWCFKRPAVRAVTFCSSAASSAFFDLPVKKRMLVGNWVSPHFLGVPPHELAKTLFGIPDETVAVGVVGRISKTKGQAEFLKAMAPLVASHPNLVLVVAGSSDFEDPEEENRLLQLATELGVQRQTKFLGNVTNTIALMDALDILVVPSMWEEPFGLVAVEGMARGLPVVATRSGGLVDIVENDMTGFLVDKSAPSIQAAVSLLIGNPVMRREMGQAGRGRAEKVFSPEPRLEDLLQLARSLAAVDEAA